MPGKPAARLTDMTAHGGTVTGPGVPTVLIGKMPAATLGDMHVCPMMTLPFLKGDETVRLGYMDPDFPLFDFQLPDDLPSPWMNVNDEGVEELKPVLQTVVVHKETNQVTLVWRGSAYYGGPQEMAQYSDLQFGAED